MMLLWATATPPAVAPPRMILRRLNSRPSAHSRRITPVAASVDRGLVGYERDRDVGAHDHPGQEVAEDDRLPDPLKDDRRHRGGAEHHGQRLEKIVGVVQRTVLGARGVRKSVSLGARPAALDERLHR